MDYRFPETYTVHSRCTPDKYFRISSSVGFMGSSSFTYLFWHRTGTLLCYSWLSFSVVRYNSGTLLFWNCTYFCYISC